MNNKKAIIIGPIFEQRIAKMAHTLLQRGFRVTVVAEENVVQDEFKEYIQGVEFEKIIVSKKLKRFPISFGRETFIKNILQRNILSEGKLLLISRDVTYAYFVSKAINKLHIPKCIHLLDIADNYDLLYDSFQNKIIRFALKIGYRYITQKALNYANIILVVSDVNRQRIKDCYSRQVENKKIFVLRNVPLAYRFINNKYRIPNSVVYVGRIDELSRDPFYILDQLQGMEKVNLHFYSAEKKETIEKIKAFAFKHQIMQRVIFHDKVAYDRLAEEISQYQFGLVAHKRNKLTDYTIPNKLYDYKSSGLVTILSDNPALVSENAQYDFGVIYHKEKDDFVEIFEKAQKHKLNFDTNIPTWDEEFNKIVDTLIV